MGSQASRAGAVRWLSALDNSRNGHFAQTLRHTSYRTSHPMNGACGVVVQLFGGLQMFQTAERTGSSIGPDTTRDLRNVTPELRQNRHKSRDLPSRNDYS